MTQIPDDMSELVNADIPRVDLVGKAANGTKFFMRKNADDSPNMFSPDEVRALIKEADLDPTVALADNEGDPVAAAIPGSPEWETVDAASAQKWISILARAKNAVETLAERETVEAATADEDDIENAWSLEGASAAIDCAIGILAVYAAGESAEVALADDAAAITKTAATLSAGDIETVEAIAAITKAGRALSAANEAALRNAADAIHKVLSSLPPAPEEAPLVKEASVAETEIPADGVAKADAPEAETLLLVFDATGKPIGVVAPDALTAVDGGAAPDDADADDDGDELGDVSADDGVDDASEVEASADPSADEAVIPGTNTIQSPVEDDPENVTKATTDIAALLKEALAPLAEQVAKAADLAGQVEVLKAQVEAYGREPDDRNSPFLNGATGTAGIAKRADSEDKFADLRKAVADAEEAKDAALIAKARQSLTFAEIKARF
jgi:hypothetical protein